MSRMTSTIPPTTQTHGAVYHADWVVVVVFTVVLLVPLSWVNDTRLARSRQKTVKRRREKRFRRSICQSLMWSYLPNN
jgi:hypothetical protein